MWASRSRSRRAQQLLGAPDNRQEEIVIVVRLHVLENTDDTLEAHTGVNVLARQKRQRAVRITVILDEDEIPEFDVPPAIPINATDVAGFALAVTRVETHVHVDFAAWAARPRITHFPEIVLATEEKDLRWGDIGFAAPETGGLGILSQVALVVLEDGGPEPFFG